MSNGWSGSDPTQVGDTNSYELGTQYLVNQQITITGIRVWAGANPLAFTNRRGHIWSTAGVLLATIIMADTLPTNGWTTYNLTSSIVVNANTGIIVGYETGGNYGGLDHALDSAVNSSDGAVTAVAAASGVHGNGSFNTSPGSQPNTASGNNTFYGIDIVYTVGSGAQPPIITGFVVPVSDAGVATATLSATDASHNPLVGASYNIDWGDGNKSLALPTGSATHTYTTSGDYGVLGWVTDTNSLTTYAAAAAEVELAGPGVIDFDPQAIMAALETLFSKIGIFTQAVHKHEPRRAPGNGLSMSLAAGPIHAEPQASGMASVAVLWTVHGRLWLPALKEPLWVIEMELIKAAWAVMGALCRSFTLGGLVRNVDLLGMYGQGGPIGGQPGYLDIDSKQFRVMDIMIPMLIGDLTSEVP